MKQVIYKESNMFYVTNERNYHAHIQNAREILKMPGFETAQEIIEYFIKYGWAKSADEFIVEI